MAQHTPTARICRACDGFAAVATGTRLPDGSRATLRVTCPTCKGTGRSVPTALVRAGR